MNQSYSIGDGMAVCAIAAGILGYLYLRFKEKQSYLAILHEERVMAVEKGIPLPELPIEPLFVKTKPAMDYRVVMLIGIVLMCFGVGTSTMLFLLPGSRGFWPVALPVTFMGGGLFMAYALCSRTDVGY